jgi:hypothetical protein
MKVVLITIAVILIIGYTANYIDYKRDKNARK